MIHEKTMSRLLKEGRLGFIVTRAEMKAIHPIIISYANIYISIRMLISNTFNYKLFMHI